ncbi:MAG: hypothetical protein Kow00109_21530 [Acidobacteriota bacterium]
MEMRQERSWSKITFFAFSTVHLAVWILLWRDHGWVSAFFYHCAWWSLLPALAAWNEWRGPGSFLWENRRRWFLLLYSSAVFWFLFEAANFRLANWKYLGLPYWTPLRWTGYVVAYATVLPAVLELDRFFQRWYPEPEPAARHVLVHRGLLWRIGLLGTLMTAAALLMPTAAFPLIWVGPWFLFDLGAYLAGRDALLRRLAKGDFRTPLRWAAAGLTCGFLWEFLNYWAGAKWIYTLPYFNFGKVFEMPILGYFGFACFAFICKAAWEVIQAVDEALHQRGYLARLAIFLISAAFVWWTCHGIDEHTVVTYQVLAGE